MDETIVYIYCLCDEVLKGLHHREDPQQHVTDAEIMTIALVAVIFFAGNFEKSRRFLDNPKYIPNMISRSRFCRRIHKTRELFVTMFQLLGEVWKNLDSNLIYAIDSFPVQSCDNYRIGRCHIYTEKKYRGYISSKRRYFYGVKVHFMVTEKGFPVEFYILPGCENDTKAMKLFSFDVCEGSVIYGDKAYNDYNYEDIIFESENVKLLPIRKSNSTRQLPLYVSYLQQLHRKIVEISGSLIERMMPKSIHAVTAAGFELKVSLFVLGYGINLGLKCI